MIYYCLNQSTHTHTHIHAYIWAFIHTYTQTYTHTQAHPPHIYSYHINTPSYYLFISSTICMLIILLFISLLISVQSHINI